MRQYLQAQAPCLIGLALLFCTLAGCGISRTEDDIIPSEDAARAALEKALTAWKSGQKAGKIEGDSRAIQVVDSVWQAGYKLESFEIVQAEDKPGPRCFSVKLIYPGSAQPQQVGYVVLGIDPLWVYRDEDYKKACGMGD